MVITKEDLLEAYNTSINNILDECDWKTSFSGEEVCGIVYEILKKNNAKLYIPVEKFHEIYSKKCDEIANTDEEWRSKNVSIVQIIDIIWVVLEEIEEEFLDLPLL
jgi:hypothetical protein